MKFSSYRFQFLLAVVLLSSLTTGFTPQNAVPKLAETPTPVGSISISGTVVNGSGGSLPKNQPITLWIYKSIQDVAVYNTTLASDGSYQFLDVPLSDQWTYLAGTTYQSVHFYSDLFYGDSVFSGKDVSLPVVIYETTADTSGIYADRAQIILDFSDENQIQVLQSFMISNLSPYVIVAPARGQPVLDFPLPEGAQNIKFENGELGDRYVITDLGFGDQQIVITGQAKHQVMVSYSLPYSSGCSFSFISPVAVRSLLMQIPAQSGVRITSEILKPNGQRVIQNEAVDFYSASDIPAGEVVKISFSGKVHLNSMNSMVTGNTSPAVGLVIFLVVVVLAVLWGLQEKQKNQPVQEPAAAPLPENEFSGVGEAELLEAIASLDDLYRMGNFDEAAYRQQRQELKAHLRSVRAAAHPPSSD